ncbi:glycosyltransferase [Methylophaga nitratireducenticrescens]|uniref:glycosyltransferase n=1 Tax=Methylophaga nitratireducenticrescens TaxID=754476 RepID=UPI000CDBB5A4|nr:glycosyltransferase [Methylophaga nitratireducenticrescens]AUZ84320.1 glycosyl transferase family 2 [Methylophaga nitratireducenticrescens]
MQKKLSVVMPVYNGEKYLRESVESVLNQSYGDFEFIIINDGSTDGSSRILSEYQKADPRIRLIERENKGLICSLNEGISKSTTELIARMDQDDICHKDRFKLQIDYMAQNPEIVALGTLVELIDADGDVISGFTTKSKHEEIDQQHIHGAGGAIIHPSVIMRKKALEGVRGYDMNCPNAEDIDLWLKLAEVGKLANLSKILLKYRQHVESIGYKQRSSQINSTINAVAAACQRRGSKFDINQLNVRTAQASKFDIHLKWAWWAYKSNQNQTGRKHALMALKFKPWSLEVLKVLYLLSTSN